ncbi:glutaminyl-peptide cyclotransferase [Ascosphaera apis ARSEF 7405]|uniref:Peptide hydrolase n=1 Tax=Ascosphaera apis ARSEF 7405 TaxID=392613 RepID=A0A167VUG4_9EURO|nr:glutaminyl-peptide cyclotransferase [Ascosphaera apis ARSEF 7405]
MSLFYPLTSTGRCWLSSLITYIITIVLSSGLVQSYALLSDDTLKSLPHPGSDFEIKGNSILAPILIPRVSGTENNAKVREHLASFIRNNLPDWNLEFQNSTSKTPVTGDKDIPFINIIATRDPPWLKAGDVSRLTLAAHYDSKFTPEGFVGAIDSAAPCAIILHAMRSIDAALTQKWKEIQKRAPNGHLPDEPGIQIMLLDGEEAFAQWTDTDSLYGARSLAASMESDVYPVTSTFKNPLSSISLFVLLDLLGSKNPKVPNYFSTTQWAYEHFGVLESRLRSLGKFKSADKKKTKKRQWFPRGSSLTWGTIEDDHIPFLQRGVDVLHVIPHPFPSVWHTLDDDAEHLDIPTVEDWGVLVSAFMAEWMDLEATLKQMDKTKSTRKSEL